MRKRKTEERIKAIEMHKQGIPRRRIAEELGVSHDSVKTWISLYKSGQKDLAALAKELRKALGCGSAMEEGKIVLQGDIMERVEAWFLKKGAAKITKSG